MHVLSLHCENQLLSIYVYNGIHTYIHINIITVPAIIIKSMYILNMGFTNYCTLQSHSASI